MKKSVRKIRIHSTNGVRSSMFWTGFRKALQTGGGTNAEGYIGIYTRQAGLKPAVYQFGDREAVL